MLVDIVSVQVAGKHKLHLEFEDGTKGTVDLSKIIELHYNSFARPSSSMDRARLS
jgi:hypothetical protein